MKKILVLALISTLALTPWLSVTLAKLPNDTNSSQDSSSVISNRENVWTSIGPSGGGWLTALAFAPPDTIYAGCDVGGVYRSTDSGEDWQIINNGLKNYNIDAIAVDPQTPKTVYLGTLGGVFKSTDGGNQWEQKRNGFPPIEQWSFSAPIASLAIDPNQPTTIYAAIGDSHGHRLGQGTIYKSLDGGENWFVVNQGTPNMDDEAIVYSIAIDPQSSDILYAGTDCGLFKSTNGGVTWEPRNTGLPHTNTRKVIIHPSDSNTLYLTIYSTPNQEPWQGGVYKTVDGAVSWMPKVNGLGNHVGNPGDPDLITSNYEQIVIDPQYPDTLYVGDISWWTPGVYKSTDGGENWTNTIGAGNRHPGIWSGVGPSVECLLIDPTNPARIFFGNSMELYRSEDAGSSWWQAYIDETPPGSGWWKGRGLETTNVIDIAIDPTDSNNVYFGFLDVGFLKSVDGGVTFKRTTQGLNYGGNIFKIIIDSDSPSVLYAGSGEWGTNVGDVVKSEDYGETWSVIGNPSSGLPDARVYALTLDYSSPISTRTLYAASYGHGVFKSIDGGTSWTAINNGLGTNGNRFVSSLVMDPGVPIVLYAGVDMQNADSNQYGGIYKTTNGGLQWNQVDTSIPNIRSLAISPQDSQTIYAGAREHYDHVNHKYFEGGVYQSTDGGQSWDWVFADPFVDEVAVDPHDPQIVYAGTADHPYHDESSGHGIFRSVNGGSNWQSMNTGLGMLSIYALEIDPSIPNVLYVGTGGNGLFKGLAPEVTRTYLPIVLRNVQ